MRKIIDIIFIGLICLIFFGGLILNYNGIKLGDVSGENRRLKIAPEMPSDLEELSKYPTEFEAYLGDNFTYRPILLKVWNTLLYQIGKSPVPKVVVGNDGWLFNNFNGVIEQFRGVTRMPLEGFVSKLIDDVDFIQDQGIPFIFFIAPNKHSVYPEHTGIEVINDYRDYDRLHDTLATFKNKLDYLDLRKLFLEKKSEGKLLYSPYGTHWNNWGGYLAYRELMTHVKTYLPSIYVLPENRFKYASCIGEDGLAKQLNVFNLSLESLNTCMTILKPVRKKVHKLNKVHIHTSEAKNNLTVLIIGDSFNLHLTQFYKESFKKTVFTAHNFGNWDRSLIKKYKPDLVVYGMVERTLTKKNSGSETMFNFGK